MKNLSPLLPFNKNNTDNEASDFFPYVTFRHIRKKKEYCIFIAKLEYDKYTYGKCNALCDAAAGGWFASGIG